MNTQLKRRLFVVSGVIVVVIILVLAIVSGTAGYQSVTVAQALEQENRNTRVQVSGQVVTDSYSVQGTTLTFSIFDPDGSPTDHLKVVYEGGVSATFGNGVTAICTGLINEQGVLECTTLVTKCPSKYETAADALTVSQLQGYGTTVEGKPLKITGVVKPGSLGSIEANERLILLDEVSRAEIPIVFTGALPDSIKDNSVLVITGALNHSGQFEATDIALRED